MGLFDVTNPRATYADKILREASVNRIENQREIEGVGIWKSLLQALHLWIATEIKDVLY